MKSKKHQRPNKHDMRWLIGGLVALAVTVIVGLKWLRAPRRVVVTSLPMPMATSPVSSTPDTTSQSAPVAPTAAQAHPTDVVADEDPFPSQPAAQVQWVMRNEKPAMILFRSTNCIPCKRMEKLVNQVRGDYEPDIVFIDVIVYDRSNTGLIRQAQIQAIPTSFFIKASGQGRRFVGATSKEVLRAELANLLERE